MSRWYSPRGARRGLISSAFAPVLCLYRATDYTQAFSRDADQVIHKNTSTPTRVDTACRSHRRRFVCRRSARLGSGASSA